MWGGFFVFSAARSWAPPRLQAEFQTSRFPVGALHPLPLAILWALRSWLCQHDHDEWQQQMHARGPGLQCGISAQPPG
jgi:hypothetical protein